MFPSTWIFLSLSFYFSQKTNKFFSLKQGGVSINWELGEQLPPHMGTPGGREEEDTAETCGTMDTSQGTMWSKEAIKYYL